MGCHQCDYWNELASFSIVVMRYQALLFAARSDDVLTQAVVMGESDKDEETNTFLTTHQHAPRHNSPVCG